MVEGSAIKRSLVDLFRPLVSMPAWKGALPTLTAAAGPRTQPADYIGPDGFRDMRGWPTRATIAPQAQDAEAARRLWRACEDMTGLTMLSR